MTIPYHRSQLTIIHSDISNNEVYLPSTAYSEIISGVYSAAVNNRYALSLASVHTAVCVMRGLLGVRTLAGAISFNNIINRDVACAPIANWSPYISE